jgi:hypothetical protein
VVLIVGFWKRGMDMDITNILCDVMLNTKVCYLASACPTLLPGVMNV